MDPIGAFIEVVKVINTMSQAFIMAFRLQKVVGGSRRRDHLSDKLKIEYRRTTRWAKQVRTFSRETLAVVILKEDERDVHNLVSRLEEAYKAGSVKLAEYDHVSSKSLRGTLARLKLALGGYEEMKELMDAIKTMNDALYEMAPPFPPNFHTVPGADNQVHTDTPLRTTEESDELEDMRRPSDENDASEEEPLGSIIADLGAVIPSSSGTRLKQLFDLATSAMETIAKETGSVLCYKSAYRMQSWGYGLFNSVASLDTVLSPNKKSDMLIVDLISKSFIKILVLQVQALVQLSSILNTTNKIQLQHLQNEIRLLLTEDGNIVFALEYSKMMLKSPSTLFILEPSEKNTDHNTYETLPDQTLQSIADIIELLFDLQPTLRAIRQSWCLQQERSSSNRTTIDTEQTIIVRSPPQASLSSDVNMQLLHIIIAIRLRDVETKKVKGPALDKALEACLKTPGPITRNLSPAIQEAIDAFLNSDLNLRESKMKQKRKQSKIGKTLIKELPTHDLYNESGTRLQPDGETDQTIDTFTQSIARLADMTLQIS